MIGSQLLDESKPHYTVSVSQQRRTDEEGIICVSETETAGDSK